MEKGGGRTGLARRCRNGFQAVWTNNEVRVTQFVELVPGMPTSKTAANPQRLLNTYRISYVVENIATEKGARTIAIDEKTHKVYMPTAKTAPSTGGGRATFIPDTFKVLVVGK